MDCWGLEAGCCLALLLHSTLLGALIPQAYERERGAVGEKEMEARKEGKKGRDVISIVTVMILHSGIVLYYGDTYILALYLGLTLSVCCLQY